MVDFSDELGKHAAERVSEEYVIWFTTTSADGTPQPRPVWFVWDNDGFLIYSQPSAAKLRHIARNPKVALHFDSGDGEDVVVFLGEASVDPSAPLPNAHQGYLTKYREGIHDIDMTEASYAASFSVAIRVRPTKLRGLDPL
ncbi:MAG: TIGR03667 family PPOX class F420-dependent oxidoreductase [Anaerolineae bacterium]|nr:TIGR03667 family PPOX class F420-dependent oxidoreductase [Anaerolineae bacterium]